MTFQQLNGLRESHGSSVGLLKKLYKNWKLQIYKLYGERFLCLTLFYDSFSLFVFYSELNGYM